MYKVYQKKENRYYAALVPIDKDSGLKRTTTSYARYLMSVHLGRFLSADEHVDHIDNDKTNDSIDNLQLLSQADNNRKEALKHPGTYIKLKCPWCGKIFVKRKSKITSLSETSYHSCSHSCASKFYRYLTNPDTREEALDRIANNKLGELKIDWTGEEVI